MGSQLINVNKSAVYINTQGQRSDGIKENVTYGGGITIFCGFGGFFFFFFFQGRVSCSPGQP